MDPIPSASPGKPVQPVRERGWRMTFLQYVAERLLGPPAKRGGSAGESYWCCPFHNDTSPSFHTMPSKPEFKDRWQCFGCGMRGDEADLMAGMIRGENYQRRRQ